MSFSHPGVRFALPLLALSAAAQKTMLAQNKPALSADVIMAHVAANQDRTEAERAHYVYLQHARVQSREGKTIMCEEITETRITPLPRGQQEQLLTLSGHVHDHHRTIRYIVPPGDTTHDLHAPPGGSADGATEHEENAPTDGSKVLDANVGDSETVLDADAGNAPVRVSDTDIDLVENMRRRFTSQKDSKDGVENGLFPLTTQQQKDMIFALKGRELKNGHDTYHVVFHPKDKDEFGWKGEAWIDAAAFEPVVVRTALSRSVPLGVRLLLGTNVPGIGFTVIYAPQGNVWFPASFGTEFKIRVLFAFHRQIVIDVVNSSFEQTHVSSTIHSGAAALVPAPK